MELDKRIINDCKIYSCFDAEKAKEYVNSEGYFSNDISDFSNLCTCYHGTLKGVYKENPKSYLNEELDKYFHFFLPEEFVMGNVKKGKEIQTLYKGWISTKFHDRAGYQI